MISHEAENDLFFDGYCLLLIAIYEPVQVVAHSEQDASSVFEIIVCLYCLYCVTLF
jgi:hypothetical protein